MRQVLERDRRTPVLNGFLNEGPGDATQAVLAPPSELLTDGFDGKVRRASACLLEAATTSFVLVTLVVENSDGGSAEISNQHKTIIG